MKISELVKELNKIKRQHGDLSVRFQDHDQSLYEYNNFVNHADIIDENEATDEEFVAANSPAFKPYTVGGAKGQEILQRERQVYCVLRS
jgi:hypothetical protein